MKKLIISIAIIAIAMAGMTGTSFAYENADPSQAYVMATEDPNVYILDVRTEAEWRWVGHPGENKTGDGAALDGKVVNISYKIFKAGNFIVNPSFLSEINEIFGDMDNVVLITMCRSGKRSVAAAIALEAAGYTAVNMVTGFEGGKDANGYRTVSGWAIDGFPYSYSGSGYAD